MKNKNSKRILEVKILYILDDSPDTSWLGEYSDTPTSEFSIDRAHEENCTSVTHSLKDGFAETHNIDIAYARTCNGTCSDCGATPDECLIKPCEYYDWSDSCDCGGHGDMQRGQYRYFNPSFNYVDESGHALKENTPDEVRKYVREDYERMESLNRGDWHFIGIRAECDIAVPTAPGNATIQHISSVGLWGIESDSENSFLEDTEQEQLADLKHQLKALGFSTRAISTAFQNVIRKDEY